MRENRRKQKEEEMKEIKETQKERKKEGGLKCLVKHIASDPKGMKTDIKNLLALIGVQFETVQREVNYCSKRI